MVNHLTVLFCGLVIAIFIGALVGAVVVQLSCALYNLLVGARGRLVGPAAARELEHAPKSDEDWARYERQVMLPGVPRPGFDRAVLIVLIATLVNAPGTFIIFRLLRLAGLATGYSVRGAMLSPVPPAIALPMGILVLAGINAAMLPTTFRKGLLVSLLSHLLALPLAIVIVWIVLTFGLRVPVGFLW
jgi:hypothetical protein